MRILFQGDSITDVGRNKEGFTDMGKGYALFVKAQLGFEEPEKYEFFNAGISGNRIVDLYARILKDVINLKPDVLSILIGVNDVWHNYTESPNGIDPDKFYMIYDLFINEIKQALPEIKIMIMEPFCLKGSGNEEYFDEFNCEVKKRAEMAKKIADKHNLKFIPLQNGFDELSKNTDPSYWLRDGVHPTSEGHEYIKNEWIKAFKSL